MGIQLPLIMWIFGGLVIIFALIQLYRGIKMIFEPKDTRLDDLVNAVRELKDG